MASRRWFRAQSGARLKLLGWRFQGMTESIGPMKEKANPGGHRLPLVGPERR